MPRDLVGGGGDNIEMRVEAFGQRLGRDPVGERDQRVEPKLEVFRRNDLIEGAAFVLAGDIVHPLALQPTRRAAASGKQHAGLLESLAHRRNAHRALAAVEPGRGDVAIGGIDGAAGKHQRAGGELDLPVALDHENLEPARSVADHQHGGGEAGKNGFGHWRALKRERASLRGRSPRGKRPTVAEVLILSLSKETAAPEAPTAATEGRCSSIKARAAHDGSPRTRERSGSTTVALAPLGQSPSAHSERLKTLLPKPFGTNMSIVLIDM